MVDHDLVGENRAGLRLEQGKGLVVEAAQAAGIAELDRLEIIEVGDHHPDCRIVGGQRGGGAAMALGLVPVAGLDRHFRQRQPAGDIFGVLLDQPQILAIGFRGRAARALQPGIGHPGFLVAAVELEDVAELDDGALGIAGLDMLERGLEMLLGAFFGGVAGGQQAQGADEEDSDQKPFEHVLYPLPPVSWPPFVTAGDYRLNSRCSAAQPRPCGQESSDLS